MATSDHLPSHPTNKDGRTTDNCFGVVGPRQCGVLMEIAGCLAASVSTQVEHLWFQQKQVEASSRTRDCALYGRMGNCYSEAQCEAMVMFGSNG